MNDSDAVLAANLEFYRAFTTRDAEAMDALWARRAPVACVHPGWPPLTDRDAVVESWRQQLVRARVRRLAHRAPPGRPTRRSPPDRAAASAVAA
jgi:hypothetical protein